MNVFHGLTTTDVNNKHQKPWSYVHRASYCELLLKKCSPSLFISHAWKYNFIDVFNALKNKFKDSTDVFIWFDLFSNNQHAAPSLPFQWWCTTFKSAIAQFGYTVMILSPCHDPVPLTRAWCLFELYCTSETKSRSTCVSVRRGIQMTGAEYSRSWRALAATISTPWSSSCSGTGWWRPRDCT